MIIVINVDIMKNKTRKLLSKIGIIDSSIFEDEMKERISKITNKHGTIIKKSKLKPGSSFTW